MHVVDGCCVGCAPVVGLFYHGTAAAAAAAAVSLFSLISAERR